MNSLLSAFDGLGPIVWRMSWHTAILAVVMTVVSFFYYLRFVRAMYIEAETETLPVKVAPSLQTALAIAVVLVVGIGVYPQPLIKATQRAASVPSLRTYDYKSEAAKEGVKPEAGEITVEPPPQR